SGTGTLHQHLHLQVLIRKVGETLVQDQCKGGTTGELEIRLVNEPNELPIGKQVSLPGHFDAPVTLEAARPLDKGFECRVRLPDGSLEETVITAEEAALLTGAGSPSESKKPTVNPERLRLLVESARIRLAYAHDKHFAVSLSGI